MKVKVGKVVLRYGMAVQSSTKCLDLHTLHTFCPWQKQDLDFLAISTKCTTYTRCTTCTYHTQGTRIYCTKFTIYYKRT